MGKQHALQDVFRGVRSSGLRRFPAATDTAARRARTKRPDVGKSGLEYEMRRVFLNGGHRASAFSLSHNISDLTQVIVIMHESNEKP